MRKLLVLLVALTMGCGVAAGVTINHASVSAYELSDATFKRTLLAASQKARPRHQRKTRRGAPHRFAEFKDIDTFVVEHDANTDTLGKSLRRAARS